MEVEKGKALYKEGNYEGALKYFTAATLSSRDRIGACDLQIGALVKLKRLETAVDVAKSMVRSNRRDPRGYIRAAQIERLADRPASASRWYQHGQKHVPRSDSLYPALQAGLKRCEQIIIIQTTRSRPCDPFTSLPLEVARIIIQNFDYRQMVAILRVSKGWRSFLSKEPVLATTVDFSCARKMVTITGLKACLRRLSQYPTNVNLAKLTEPAVHDVRDRLPQWFAKNTLRHFVSDEKMPLAVDALPSKSLLQTVEATLQRGAPDLLEKCPNLQHLRLRNCCHWGALEQHNQLRSFLVNNGNTPVALFEILPFPSLRHLSLSGVILPNRDVLTPLTSLVHLQLTHCKACRDLSIPPSLEILSFVNLIFHGRTLANANILNLSNLVHLRADLSTWNISLESLNLDHSRLEFLDLLDQQLTDAHASTFSRMTSLRQLRIRAARLISGIFIKDIIESTPGNLEYIGLAGCEGVTPSTTEWAQARHGVRVEIKNAVGDLGGRRVFT